MKALVPGHRYALDNLESDGETILQFYQDPALHGGEGADGPSCQEVLRAVIDRVQELNRERSDVENAGIIYDLRHAIAGFEARAVRRRVEKDALEIERLPVASDGHLLLAPSAETLAPIENALALMASALSCGEPFTSYCESALAEARVALACVKGARDSGSGAEREDAPQSAAEAVGPQSGGSEASASPSPKSPSHGRDQQELRG